MGNDLGKLEPPRLFRRKKTSTPQAPGPLNEPLEREGSTPSAEPERAIDAPEADDAAADAAVAVDPDPDEPTAAGTEDTTVQEPAHGPVPEPTPDPVEAPTTILPTQDPAEPAEPAGPAATAEEPAATPQRVQQAPEAPPAPQSREKRVRRPLQINGHLAALVGGVVAGALLAGLTWAAEAADNTESNRIDALMLVAIFVISVVAGTLTLRLLKVTSPGTIAFLGTALTAVLAVVALGGHLDEAGGAIGVFLISAAAYPLARWVTVRYIDEAA